ncbi:MAG: GIY-YIG nuclease family protein [Candidatus Marinimicrobia bacterium]|jgi:putative endonuclease|nr:GIY-YIG nuclease family protein [Candidatus Neomarinimicrobiota bacterium]MBT3631810.1 GIY-YIG nuclease family protein [Candidatus Neomarinimicrobiota bacterium]MBT3825031.1 GIY-YIG nuclease family protein [Candidatus Neomarinimicrobiota bacterium]MBT4130430.1 GIY-YIG nuclease family protein [Candidatus Neomarinimicrobiota bacterium]MBT4296418.1 GIY-YIG nuclease family protein [Candidatus Neomarinimicrobiota bacterium]
MYYVYCIENVEKNYLYVGSTSNLSKRIEQHNTGRSKSTRPYMPLKLTAYIGVPTERQARRLEKYVKTGSGKAILKKRILQTEALV